MLLFTLGIFYHHCFFRSRKIEAKSLRVILIHADVLMADKMSDQKSPDANFPDSIDHHCLLLVVFTKFFVPRAAAVTLVQFDWLKIALAVIKS